MMINELNCSDLPWMLLHGDIALVMWSIICYSWGVDPIKGISSKWLQSLTNLCSDSLFISFRTIKLAQTSLMMCKTGEKVFPFFFSIMLMSIYLSVL